MDTGLKSDGRSVVFTDNVVYEGPMDERTREAIRRRSHAAAVLGGIVRASDHEDAAIVLEGAGAVGSAATSGKDYTAEVRFRCRIS